MQSSNYFVKKQIGQRKLAATFGLHQKKIMDYREIIKNEFEKRCGVNKSYSLRSFSKDIGITPPRLSNVLNGNQGLSHDYAKKIGKNMGLSQKELEYFCDLVESKHARSKVKKAIAKARLNKYASSENITLRDDTLKIVSDWYHMSIIELSRIEGFQGDSEWIAKSLGISKHVAKSAFERLLTLGILKYEDGQYIPTEEFFKSPTDIPSETIRDYHRQILAKAEEALIFQTVDERDFSSLTMAFNKEELADAKAMMRQFRRDFMAKFEKNITKDSVYNLSMQLFKMDHGNRKLDG